MNVTVQQATEVIKKHLEDRGEMLFGVPSPVEVDLFTTHWRCLASYYGCLAIMEFGLKESAG
jgi:hypothetical protein